MKLHEPFTGLHELDALQDQEVKDFRSKMFRISEEKMQRVQLMTWSEWLQACFSPQLEPGGGATPVTDGVNDKQAEASLKVTMHFDQSQVTTVSVHTVSTIFPTRNTYMHT
jgi:hypothetical protein